MKNWLFCWCLFGFATIFWSPELQSRDLRLVVMPVALEEMRLPVFETLEQNEAYSLYTFFNRFLFSERVLNEMVALALSQGLSTQNVDELLKLVFMRFSFLGSDLDQRVARARELRNAGADPFSAFARALYEGTGFSPIESASRVAGLLTRTTIRRDVESAFWTEIFHEYGLTEVQALRAFHVMDGYLEKGFSYWKAFSLAVFSQFYLGEAMTFRLSDYQEWLVVHGVSPYLAIYKALFSVFGSQYAKIQDQSVASLEARLQSGEPLVAAYYAVRFGWTGLSEAAVQQAIRFMMDIFDNDSSVIGRERAYIFSLYRAFGFPEALADRMTERNQTYFTHLGVQADPLYVFWKAAFRIMGVKEDRLDEACRYFVKYHQQGYSVRESFERAFIQLFTSEDKVDSITSDFLSAGVVDQGNGERLRHLLFTVWKHRYPWVAEATLGSGIGGFFKSPSALSGSGVLGVFSGFQEDS